MNTLPGPEIVYAILLKEERFKMIQHLNVVSITLSDRHRRMEGPYLNAF